MGKNMVKIPTLNVGQPRQSTAPGIATHEIATPNRLEISDSR